MSRAMLLARATPRWSLLAFATPCWSLVAFAAPCWSLLSVGCTDDASSSACAPGSDWCDAGDGSCAADGGICDTFPPNAVGRFSFDTCAYTSPDATGSGRNLTLVGDANCGGRDMLSAALGTSWSSGTALSCDGDGDYAAARDDAAFEPAQFTLSAWIYSHDYLACGTGECTIVSKSNTDETSNGYWLMIALAGDAAFTRLVICADGLESAFRASAAVTSRAWHHVVATFDGSVATLYLDGQATGSMEVPGGMTFGDEAFRVGAVPNRPFDFHGYIDEVALWSYPKTADEVALLYDSYFCPQPACQRNCCPTPPPT